MTYIKVGQENNKDIKIYYKEWGTGQPVVFSHGWPLSSDAWEDQMLFLAYNGYRTIAHDRRGHGRSTQTSDGNVMDTYADDLAKVIEALDLREVILVGHSTGGGEVTRYIGRHGTSRLSKVVLIGAVPPLMLRTANNPQGIPMEFFHEFRKAFLKDRSQFLKDLSYKFYGATPAQFLKDLTKIFDSENKASYSVSEGLRESFWLQGMLAGYKNLYECIKAFSETDFTEDLKKIDKPTLIIHGDQDQIVPIDDSAKLSVKLIPNAQLKIYKSAPHGLCSTHKDEVNQDLLKFIRS